MAGFVGSNARKRRRNIVLSLAFIFLFGIFYFIYPTLENINREIVPKNNESLPSEYLEDFVNPLVK